VLAQQAPAANHQIDGALAAAVHSVGVVQFARAIDACPPGSRALKNETV
jgi:hypothetical protein